MPSRASLAVPTILLAAVATTGCGAHGHAHHSHHGRVHTHGSGEAVALGVGLLAGAAIVAAASDPPPPPPPLVVRETVVITAPPPPPGPPPPPSPRDRSPSELPQFDPIAARVALNAVDVAPCRAAGAPSGRGHAFVTVDPDGSISKVVVDEPSGMSPEAVECVGRALGAVRVKPFRGSHVSIGAVWTLP